MTGFDWRKASRGICLTAVIGSMAGCTVGPEFKAPFFPFANSFAERRSSEPVLLTNAAWWRSFKDPVLDELIARALNDNLNLALVKERVVEAKANVRAVPVLGRITPEASITRTTGDSVRTTTEAEGTLGLSWLLDPFGARRQQLKAARARVEVADAEVDAARLLLLFNLSNAYIDLRFNQRSLQLRRQELNSRRQTLVLTRKLFDRKSATRLDIVQADALVAETAAQIPALRAAIRSQKHQIAVLLGKAPGTLDIDLDRRVRQPRARMSPDVGIPADLLRNRPDIRIAERLYYASVAEIGAAQANLYPQLSLGGAIMLTALRGNSGIEYSFGPSVQIPSLLNTDTQAVVEVRDSQARQALTSWRATVLTAIQQVESALVEYAGSIESVSGSQRAVRLNHEAADLTRELIARDIRTIRDLIEAEQAIANADTILAENLRQLGRNFVTLNVNLGSGSRFGETGGNALTD